MTMKKNSIKALFRNYKEDCKYGLEIYRKSVNQ